MGSFAGARSSNPKHGWWNIKDSTFTDKKPLKIKSGKRTKIKIHADSVIDDYSPLGMPASKIFNSETGKITPLNTGSSYVFTLAMKVNSKLNNRNLLVELDVGGSEGTIFAQTVRLARGTNTDTMVNVSSTIYALGSFFMNGGELYITCDGNISLFDMTLFIQKTN